MPLLVDRISRRFGVDISERKKKGRKRDHMKKVVLFCKIL